MRADLLFEQGTGIMNEDYHCANGDLFGVFDGATSLTGVTYDEKTGGFLAARIAANTVAANNDTLTNLVHQANGSIHNAMTAYGVDPSDRSGLWCASGAVVRLADNTFEWAQIGDCLILSIHEDGHHELLTPGFDHDQETLRLWKEYAHTTDDTILSAMHEQIARVRANQNITYGVLNGEEAARSFLRTGSSSLEGIRHLLLFTDGLFIPKRNPAERDDFSLFTQLFLDGGLPCVHDYIRTLERTDTRCCEFPRFKTHDDIAAYAISL